MSKLPTRMYLVFFIDGEYAYSEGVDGMDASRKAAVRWGVTVDYYALPGSRNIRVLVAPR